MDGIEAVNKFEAELAAILDDVKAFDIYTNEERDGNIYITREQADLFHKFVVMMCVFGYQVKLAKCRRVGKPLGEVVRKPLFGAEIGSPVLVRPCGEEYGGKTYFGLMIGEMATSIHLELEEDEAVPSFSHHNPAILVPELGRIIYGYKSFWSRIDSEEELSKAITDETIQNCWYMKLLKHMLEKKDVGQDDE